MSNILRRRGQDPSANNKENVLTALMFLTMYIPAEQVLYFIDNARIEDINEIETLFLRVKEKGKMTINRRVLTDKGGNEYTYQNFIQSKGTEGVKVVTVGNIKQFITDYQQGKFITDFTLEDLVAEAEKA